MWLFLAITVPHLVKYARCKWINFFIFLNKPHYAQEHLYMVCRFNEEPGMRGYITHDLGAVILLSDATILKRKPLIRAKERHTVTDGLEGVTTCYRFPFAAM